MKLRTAQGKLKIEHSIIEGVRDLLKRLLEDNPDTIRSVNAGRKEIPPEIAAKLADHVASETLTPRQEEVLRGVAEGISNLEIAKADQNVGKHLAGQSVKRAIYVRGRIVNFVVGN